MEDTGFTRIACPRVVVRRFAAPDAAPLAAYRSDPEVSRYQAWECPYPLAEAERFVAGLTGIGPGRPGTWFQFAVALGPEEVLIGDVALRTSRSEPRQAELGFSLARDRQGSGYASEAVGAVVDYAFGTLALHRIVALTDARNRPAQELLERLGFRCEGELRESVWSGGAWADERLYARLASDPAPPGGRYGLG